MNIIEKLETKIKGYYYKTMNLNEFIREHNLEMILNNDLISYDNLYFELDNYDNLSENEFYDFDISYFKNELLKIINNDDNLSDDLKKQFRLYIENENKEIYHLYEPIQEFIDDKIDEFIYENDIYQYYIISEYDVDTWNDFTTYPIYYEPNLDLYLLGIDHYGISWNLINTYCSKKVYV